MYINKVDYSIVETLLSSLVFVIDWLLRLLRLLLSNLLQNELFTYLWYLNFGCTFRSLGVI